MNFPALLIALGGAVFFIVSRRKLGGAATVLGIVGCLLMALNASLGIGMNWYYQYLPELVSDGDLSFGAAVMIGDSAMIAVLVLGAAGLVLLIAAALAGRRRPDSAS